MLRTPQGRVRRADQGLGRPDRQLEQRSLHEEGDGLAEGLGADVSCIYGMMNATDYKGAFNHHFPGVLKV